MTKRTLAALLAALTVYVSTTVGVSSELPAPSLSGEYVRGTVAEVGSSRITSDEVFELWTPVWYDTLTRVRTGKMTSGEGDAKLQEEWRRIITALVKDEILFQLAEQEHSSQINNYVDMIVRNQNTNMSRQQITAKVRKDVQQSMEREFRLLNAEFVKEAGGIVKLRKVLQTRGLTMQEWQSRLKKKAFTQSYLQLVIGPLVPNPGPKQIQEYYVTHGDEFALPGLVRFKHIFFSNAVRGEEKARDDAVEVWQDLVDGVIDFDAAVLANSDDPPSRDRGGMESGEEASDPEREAWLVDVRAALKNETPDEITPILESPFGCHIAILLSVGPERKAPFGEVRETIERKLKSKVWDAETDRYFALGRRNTPIRVPVPDFPAHLSCAAQATLGGGSPVVYTIGGGGVSPDMRGNNAKRNQGQGK